MITDEMWEKWAEEFSLIRDSMESMAQQMETSNNLKRQELKIKEMENDSRYEKPE